MRCIAGPHSDGALEVMTRKDQGFGAAWRAVRRWGGGELARSSAKRFREADGTSHVRALAYQSMFVLLSGFIGLVGLASAFDLPRVRGIVEQMADTLSPGPSARLLREAARQGANGGTTAMVLGLLAALLAGTLAMAQVERSANRLAGRSEDRSPATRYAGGRGARAGRRPGNLRRPRLGWCGSHGLDRGAVAPGGCGGRCGHLPPIPSGAARAHRLSRGTRRGSRRGGRVVVPIQPRPRSVLLAEQQRCLRAVALGYRAPAVVLPLVARPAHGARGLGRAGEQGVAIVGPGARRRRIGARRGASSTL